MQWGRLSTPKHYAHFSPRQLRVCSYVCLHRRKYLCHSLIPMTAKSLADVCSVRQVCKHARSCSLPTTPSTPKPSMHRPRRLPSTQAEGWTTASLAKMTELDAFLKGSQRLSGRHPRGSTAASNSSPPPRSISAGPRQVRVVWYVVLRSQ